MAVSEDKAFNKHHAVDDRVIHKVEEFARPENYVGGDLITITNIAQLLRDGGAHSHYPSINTTALQLQPSSSGERTVDSSALNRGRILTLLKDRIIQARLSSVLPSLSESQNFENPIYGYSNTHALQHKISIRIGISPHSTASEIETSLLSTFTSSSSSIPTKFLFGVVHNRQNRMLIRVIAKTLFKWTAKHLQIWIRYVLALHDKMRISQQREFQELNFSGSTFHSDSLKKFGLSFNPSDYKAKREMVLTAEMKSILCLPPLERSPEQVQTVMFGLQHLQAFHEYPLHMQKKLCQAATYLKIPQERIILRQGHIAERFYIILSGRAIVTILSSDDDMRTVNILGKGTSFGEIALLHHSLRTASVVSKTSMELLAVERKDFFDIFMGSSVPGSMPEHIKFLSDLPWMRNYAVEIYLRHPEKCLLHFFRRGTVIMKNAQDMDWIFIVMSGSCSLMKRMKVIGDEELNKHSISVNHRRMATEISELEKEDGLSSTKMGRRSPFLLSIDGENDFKVTPIPFDLGIGPTGCQVHTHRAKDLHSLLPDINLYNGHKSLVGRRRQSENRSSIQKETIFINFAVLQPGDVHGLSNIVFVEEMETIRDVLDSVSLVSNGAECILLNKPFFLSHANENVLNDVKKEIRPFPREGIFRENYYCHRQWEQYKNEEYRRHLGSRRRKYF